MNSDLVTDFVNDLRAAGEERYELVQRLRKLVLSVDGRITEDIKYGGILFSAGAPFCGLFSYPQHVALEFSRGAELDDKHKVLEGEGKKRRHIKLLSGADLFKKNVREYVAMALAATVPKAGARPRPRPRA